jgi:undecaprenyl-diphosphatase
MSGLYELYSERESLLDENLVMMLIATLVAGVVGYLSIAFLIKFLKTHTNMLFIIYRIALGILILILMSQGVLTNL